LLLTLVEAINRKYFHEWPQINEAIFYSGFQQFYLNTPTKSNAIT